MKKVFRIFWLIIIVLWMSIFPAEATNKFFWAIGLIGATGALDTIDGASVADGDMAIVGVDTGGTYQFYPYRLEDYAANPPDESSPDTITPNTNAGNKRWKLLEVHASGFVEGGVGLPTTTDNNTWTGTNTFKNTVTFQKADGTPIMVIPSSPSGSNGYLISIDIDGTMSYVDPTSLAVDLSGYIPKTDIDGAGVFVGTGVTGEYDIISTPAANNFFGTNSSGLLGFYPSMTTVYVAAPESDHLYSGTIASFVAGHNLAQWDVVYCKPNGEIHACYKYDVDTGDDTDEPPRGVVTNTETAGIACAAGADCNILINGIVRNDGWAHPAISGMSSGSAEGKKVYGSTTAGSIELTPNNGPVIGYVLEENVVYFNFANQEAFTGTGLPVKATSPALTTPNIGAATGTSLIVTGIVDSLVHVEATNGKTIDKLSAFYVATGTNSFIVPTPSAAGGNQYCFKQSNNATNAITVIPVHTSGVMLENTAGTAYCTADDKLVSGGGKTDKLCIIALDATHYETVSSTGTWTCTAH